MVTEIQVPVPIQLPPAQLQMPVWHFSYRDRHHGPLLTATAPRAFGTGQENLYSDNLNMSAAHCRFQGAARAGAQAAAQTLQASPVPTLDVSIPLLQLPQGEALLSPEPLQVDFTHWGRVKSLSLSAPFCSLTPSEPAQGQGKCRGFRFSVPLWQLKHCSDLLKFGTAPPAASSSSGLSIKCLKCTSSDVFSPHPEPLPWTSADRTSTWDSRKEKAKLNLNIPLLICCFALCTGKPKINKRNFSQTPLPPPALLIVKITFSMF